MPRKTKEEVAAEKEAKAADDFFKSEKAEYEKRMTLAKETAAEVEAEAEAEEATVPTAEAAATPPLEEGESKKGETTSGS